MGRRVKFLFTVFFLLISTGFSGCGEEETKESAGGRIYFLNDAETQLVAEGYEMKATFRAGAGICGCTREGAGGTETKKTAPG